MNIDFYKPEQDFVKEEYLIGLQKCERLSPEGAPF